MPMLKRSHVLMILLAVVCMSAARAQDPRLLLFERYNRATTYEEIRPILSGVLAQQYESIASKEPQRVPQILTQQRLVSYRSRIVEIDDATSFVVLENVRQTSSRNTGPLAYIVVKEPRGVWTLANRLPPESVIKALWTTRFRPTDFAQASSCTVNGRTITTESALAIRQGDIIQVTLYPFTFSEADLDYWRQMSGMAVNGNSVASSHFNGPTPRCRVVIRIDTSTRLSLVNVGFDDRTASSLWPPSPADGATLAMERDVLAVVTAGVLGPDAHGFRWNVRIRVPLWQKGL